MVSFLRGAPLRILFANSEAVYGGCGLNSEEHKSRWAQALGVLRLLAGAAVVGLLFEKLGVPAGMLFGSVIGAALVNQRWFRGLRRAEFPRSIRAVGLLSVGIVSGVLLTTESLISTATVAFPIVVAYLCLGGVNLLLITLLMSRYGAGPATAVLAVTPGGMAEITSMAVDKGAQVSLVVVLQSVRLLTLVLVLLPLMLVVLTP